MKTADDQTLKTLAMLLAMQQYKGDKTNGEIFIHCALAVENLNLILKAREKLAEPATADHEARARNLQFEAIARTAKLLGLYKDEPAGFPNAKWMAKHNALHGRKPWGGVWGKFGNN